MYCPPRPDLPMNRDVEATNTDVAPEPSAFWSVREFCRHACPNPLREYQLEVVEAVADSVVRRDGKVFVVMMSRQSGKNELAAVLYAYLLNLFAVRGGDIIIGAPTYSPQIDNSARRLERVLSTPYNKGRWSKNGNCVEMGAARLTFLSGEPTAHIVGATASLLLAVDEAQDVDPEVYDKSFRPMASTTNATTVLFGTALNEDNILEDQRRLNRPAQDGAGERLNFEVPWTVLASENPSYKRFVESEIERLGEDHPTIRTQYLLEPVAGSGRLFPAELLQRLRGTHRRLTTPDNDFLYVAGVDVAGTVLADGRSILNDRDETVITIAQVDRTTLASHEPILRVVEHYHWRGLSHELQHQKLKQILLYDWRVMKLAIDATGMGQGLASYLMGAAPNKVDPVVFTSRSKSDLGFELLAMAERDRLSIYQCEGSEELEECFNQLKYVTYSLKGYENMTWQAGGSGHDDYVVSLALCVRAANGLLPSPAGGIVRNPDWTYEEW